MIEAIKALGVISTGLARPRRSDRRTGEMYVVLTI